MDQLLKGCLNTFLEKIGKKLKESEAFEYFVNYTILSKIHPGRFEIDETIVGGESDTGIDGIAIIVNDHIINSYEEVQGVCKSHKCINVKFIFIQSKTLQAFPRRS